MERVLANKANYLAELGYEVIIITTDQLQRKPFFALSPRIQSYDIDINYSENNGKGFIHKILHYPFKLWKHQRRLTKLLIDLRADIVISMFCNDVAFITKIRDGSKKVLEIHFSKFKRLQYDRKGVWKWADWLRSKMDEKTVRKFDRFIVLTHEDKCYWGDLPNIEVIENAMTEWTKDCSANLNHKQVIAVGRFDFQKGFERLIEAWHIVNEFFPDWSLKIIGDGEQRPALEKLITQYNLTGVVELKKSVTGILDEYLDASILVMSSRYEGLPMVLIEAMSVGLPVVSFACKCGPQDVITEGEDGFLVPEGDIKELTERMMRLMADPNLRQKMGKVAKLNSQRYATPAIMARWMKLFDTLKDKKS